MAADLFDISVVIEKFRNAAKDSQDDVVMDFYMEAFNEILKFFNGMGTIFGFVSSDIKAKLTILEEFRRNNEGIETVKTMIDYEKSAGLLQKKDYVSGCRTLLRLHRGLDFTRDFLRRLSQLKPDDKTSEACKISYQETLASYHTFLIRKGAGIAMAMGLPARDDLLAKVCKDVQKSIESLPEMLMKTDEVYDRIQNLYKTHDLLALP